MLMLLIKGQDALRYAYHRIREEDGQTLIEYALIATLVAVAAIALLVAVGFDIQETFDSVENVLGNGQNGTTPPGDNDETL